MHFDYVWMIRPYSQFNDSYNLGGEGGGLHDHFKRKKIFILTSYYFTLGFGFGIIVHVTYHRGCSETCLVQIL